MRITTYASDAFEGQFALRLRETCRAFRLDLDVFGAGEGDNPRHSTRLRCLLRSLQTPGAQDVLYVDPDAQILRRPEIPMDEKDFDVGVYYDSKTLAMNGPIFLRNTPRIMPLLREWGIANQAHPDRSEYENLANALGGPGHSVTVRRFPVTYAWVDKLHRKTYPTAAPVIVHFKPEHLITGRFTLPR
jgi:hypothetical protein